MISFEPIFHEIAQCTMCVGSFSKVAAECAAPSVGAERAGSVLPGAAPFVSLTLSNNPQTLAALGPPFLE